MLLDVNQKVQLCATLCTHLFTAKSLYMFRVSQHPLSEALKTVTATSGIGHNTGRATSFQCGLIRTDVTCQSFGKKILCYCGNPLSWLTSYGHSYFFSTVVPSSSFELLNPCRLNTSE